MYTYSMSRWILQTFFDGKVRVSTCDWQNLNPTATLSVWYTDWMVVIVASSALCAINCDCPTMCIVGMWELCYMLFSMKWTWRGPLSLRGWKNKATIVVHCRNATPCLIQLLASMHGGFMQISIQLMRLRGLHFPTAPLVNNASTPTTRKLLPRFQNSILYSNF